MLKCLHISLIPWTKTLPHDGNSPFKYFGKNMGKVDTIFIEWDDSSWQRLMRG